MKVALERINQEYLFEVSNPNGHRVLLDNKSKTEGSVKGISPMELLLMGLAGCSSIDVVAILNKQKINPTSIKMEVEGQRPENTVPALFNAITVKILLEGDFSAEKAQRAVALSFDKYCSVSKTLEHTATIDYEIYLNGEKI